MEETTFEIRRQIHVYQNIALEFMMVNVVFLEGYTGRYHQRKISKNP